MKLKHLPILLCLTLCISLATAQKPEKVKKVTEKVSFGTATYQVLKSDKITKHGTYKVMDYIYKQPLVVGTYLYGEKNGVWKAWYAGINHLKNEGTYKANKKVGIWKYYDYFGVLLHSYNHDTDTLIFSSACGTDTKYEVLVDGKSVWKTLDCPPAYLGGISNLNIDITNTYINSKKENTNAVGAIYADISILVKKDGTVGDLRANEPLLNQDFRIILEDMINNTKGEWLPAELDGEKEDAYVVLKSVISSYQTSD